MILVYGMDGSFVDDVISHLKDCGHVALRVPADAHLFSEVVAHRASALIGLAPDASSDETLHGELVESLIAASKAPLSPRIVLVTPQPLDGPQLRGLKRSGASYVVVSSLGVRWLSRGSKRARGKVWLSRRLLEPEHALVTDSALLCAIATAVSDECGTGIQISPQSASWREALQALGVQVLAVPNWLARFAYSCGAPALYLATGRMVARLPDERAAPMVAALPRATATT